MLRRRVQLVAPTLYVAFAVYGWVDFVHTNHDGLANVGLLLITLPVSMLCLAVGSLTGQTGMPMPQGHGYIGDHALYYVPAVAVTASLFWLVGRAVDRALAC